MTDKTTVAALRAAAHAEVRDHHLEPGTADAAWSAAQIKPRQRRRYLAVAATIVGIAGASTALAAVHSTDGTSGLPADRPTGTSACTGNVSTDELPSWASSGFTGGGLPHVIGTQDEIVAVLFVDLRVHQPYPAHNKILWVPRHGTGGGPLRIRAHLAGSSVTVTRTVAQGPGPSYVDMPAAGCWEMTLRWSTYRDTLALRYLP